MACGRTLYRCCVILIITFLMGCMVLERSYSQAGQGKIISGTVIEKESGEPLELVHVYISYSTMGATTDQEGYFEFSTDLGGSHQLVFSFIGYQTITADLNLDLPQNHFTYTAEMEASAEELGEIEVVTSNTEWQQNLEQFNRHFIGSTEFSRETVIENPWVLDFERNSSRQFVATASQPIHIVNFALGYRLYVDLEEFMWDAGGETGLYTYQIRFEELSSESPQRMQTWQRNRERAYSGSFEHFLISLYHEDLSKNHFEIVLPGTNNQTTIQEMGQFHVQQRLRQFGLGRTSSAAADGLKGYRLPQPVDILYGRPGSFQDNRQRGRIVPLTDRKEFFVTKEGRLLNPLSLRRDGYWRLHRTGNLLPVEYSLN